jgi:hypothetical protein
MSMSKTDRKYLDDVVMSLNDAVVELRDKIIVIEKRFDDLHQEVVALKHKNGLK